MEDGDATQPDLLAAWRRLLLWGLPAVQGAVVLALLLGRGDTWDRLVDPWLYLTISLVLTGSWLAVLSGRGSLRQITVLLTAGSALFLNAKLLLLAALLPDPGALLPELLETLVWLPAVITWTMLTDLARPVRRILNWMMAGVVTLSAVVAVRPLLIGHPLDMAALRALLQINLSALVSLYGASFFLRRSDLLGRAQGEQQVLRQLVYTDLLTGLPGRVRLSEQLRTLTGQGRPFAVLFVDVDAFGKQAEIVGKYFRKGRCLLVEGRLKLDQWDDKQTGQKRSRLGVVLESFSFGAAGENKSAEAREAAPAKRRAAVDAQPPTERDNDVPF